MKKIICTAIIILSLTACQNQDADNQQKNTTEATEEIITTNPSEPIEIEDTSASTTESSNEETDLSAEDFTGEYLVNFPDIKNPIVFMNLDINDITFEENQPDKIKFNFPDAPYEDEGTKNSSEFYTYLLSLRESGYTVNGSDGTVVSKLWAENEENYISILLSKIDHYQEFFTDEEMDFSKYENGIVEIEVMKK